MKINIKIFLKLKSILFYFCIIFWRCGWHKDKIKTPEKKCKNNAPSPTDTDTDEDNKPKASGSNQYQNQVNESLQSLAYKTNKLDKHIKDKLNQPNQALIHQKKTYSGQLNLDITGRGPYLKSSNQETKQEPIFLEKLKSIKECDDYFVLFHGLTESKDTFEYFEPNFGKALQARGWTNIKFIYPLSREGLSSVWSLHVDDVFKEIKDKVGNAKVHLIGYSQGGLVAGHLEMEKKYKDQLNIASAVYIATPFLGVGAMKASKDEVKDFINNTNLALDKLMNSQDINTNTAKKAIKVKQRVLSMLTSFTLKRVTKGLNALCPNNNQNMVKHIRSGSKEVPRLVIGGFTSFIDIFDIPSEVAKILDWNYAKLLKKEVSPDATMQDNSMKNDTMIPFPSQLARRGSIDKINLAGIDDKGLEIPGPDGCINTTYYVLNKTPHAWNLPILDEGLCIQKTRRPILASPEVASRVADFLADQMETDSQVN